MVSCSKCVFMEVDACTYPSRIGVEEYTFKDGRIVGCTRGREE